MIARRILVSLMGAALAAPILFSAVLAAPDGAKPTSLFAELDVGVTGIKADGGEVTVGVFDEATFPLQPHQPLVSQTVAAAKAARVVFTMLPPGTYALRAVQMAAAKGAPPVGTAVSRDGKDFDGASFEIAPGVNNASLVLK